VSAGDPTKELLSPSRLIVMRQEAPVLGEWAQETLKERTVQEVLTQREALMTQALEVPMTQAQKVPMPQA
jgi:hypothetical protein